MGHARPFEFATEYAAAPGVARYLCGTPSVLALTALDEGLDVLIGTQAHGGLAALEAKAARLTQCFIDLVEEDCAGHGMTLVTPREPRLPRQPGQLHDARRDQAHAVVQA